MRPWKQFVILPLFCFCIFLHLLHIMANFTNIWRDNQTTFNIGTFILFWPILAWFTFQRLKAILMNILKTFLTQSFKPRSVKSQIQSLCLSLQTGKAENDKKNNNKKKQQRADLTCCIHLWKPIIEQPVTWRKHVKWCCSWSSVSSVWFSGKDVKMCQDEHVDAISAALTCCYFLRPGNGSRFLEESCILLPESKWNTELVLVLPIYFRGIVWETLSRFLQTHLFHLIIAALWIFLLFCSFFFFFME